MGSPTNINKWIEENEKDFLPPVCNKMLHNSQLKVFYVGGPNQRKDFHLEEGEELFYMKKGDMELIVMENGAFRNIPIKEGEIFLLAGKIPHSPQRKANTVGLVIERERLVTEKDCLRYYVDGSKDSLFERWFYCEDLGKQLGPVIQEFFASEEYRTGRPIPGSSVPDCKPYEPDNTRELQSPFNLKLWVEKNRSEINTVGEKHLFDESYESDIIIHGPPRRNFAQQNTEIWFWQLEGSRKVTVDHETYELKEDHSLLVLPNKSVFLEESAEGALTISVVMNPFKKNQTI